MRHRWWVSAGNAPDRAFDPSVWVDPSPVVPCSEPHTLETTQVVPVEKTDFSQTLVRQLGAGCDNAAAQYVEDGEPNWLPLRLRALAFEPSPRQRDAGQYWVRCDISVVADVRRLEGTAIRGSVFDSLGGGKTARYRFCLPTLLDPQRDQRLVSCLQPHRSEMSTWLQVDASKTYPTQVKLIQQGRSQCLQPTLDKSNKSLSGSWLWRDVQHWRQDGRGPVPGQCWVYSKDGSTLPGL